MQPLVIQSSPLDIDETHISWKTRVGGGGGLARMEESKKPSINLTKFI